MRGDAVGPMPGCAHVILSKLAVDATSGASIHATASYDMIAATATEDATLMIYKKKSGESYEVWKTFPIPAGQVPAADVEGREGPLQQAEGPDQAPLRGLCSRSRTTWRSSALNGLEVCVLALAEASRRWVRSRAVLKAVVGSRILRFGRAAAAFFAALVRGHRSIFLHPSRVRAVFVVAEPRRGIDLEAVSLSLEFARVHPPRARARAASPAPLNPLGCRGFT